MLATDGHRAAAAPATPWNSVAGSAGGGSSAAPGADLDRLWSKAIRR